MTGREQSLADIRQHIVDGHLGKAIEAMENHLYTYPQANEADRFAAIEESYRLMAEYWLRGYPDPQREQLYRQLFQQLFVLTTDLQLRQWLNANPQIMMVYSRTRKARTDWSLTALRRDLENHVSEQALLELEPEHTRGEKLRQLYERHQQTVSLLFDYIWTSRSWSEAVADKMLDMLLSPTLDTIDQQLLVSAVTLAVMNQFDFQKFRLLVSLYEQSADVDVAQRALIGWALSLDDTLLTVYPEIQNMVDRVTADPVHRQQLKELQMQLVYCLKTDADNERIQHEIMPELIKNNNEFRITRNGLEEIDEDSIDDMLHPEEAERKMEQLEATMQKMVDMQRAGSDIYFAGFSQMKRFPFFADFSNWFVPFYPQHPGLAGIWSDNRRVGALQSMLGRMPFCASDSYSFALAFNQVADRLPASLLDMLERGEAQLVGEAIDETDRRQPAYIRRMYLQDLYRFFKLHPQRQLFATPFGAAADNRQLFFLSQSVYCGTPLSDSFVEVAAFLVRHKLYEGAALLIANVAEPYDERYYLTCATLLKHVKIDGLALSVVDCYRQAVAISPDNDRALVGLARAAFEVRCYDEALMAYERMAERHPGQRSYVLNAAVCLTSLERYDEALKILYKLNYENPDDTSVERVLAWTLVCDGKLEQAQRMYEKLRTEAQPTGEDLLNYGLCRWLQHDASGALELFRDYAEGSDRPFDAEREFRRNEVSLLHRHGITDTEISLMIDQLRA